MATPLNTTSPLTFSLPTPSSAASAPSVVQATPRPNHTISKKTQVLNKSVNNATLNVLSDLGRSEPLPTTLKKEIKLKTVEQMDAKIAATKDKIKLKVLEGASSEEIGALKEKLVKQNAKRFSLQDKQDFTKECLSKTSSELESMRKEKFSEVVTLSKSNDPSQLGAISLAKEKLEIVSNSNTIKGNEEKLKNETNPKEITLLSMSSAKAYLALHITPSKSDNSKIQSFNQQTMGNMAVILASDSSKIQRFSGGSGGIYNVGNSFAFKSVQEEPGMPLEREGTTEDATEDQDAYPIGESPLREFACASSPLSNEIAAFTSLESPALKQEGSEVSPKKGLITPFVSSEGSLQDFMGLKSKGVIEGAIFDKNRAIKEIKSKKLENEAELVEAEEKKLSALVNNELRPYNEKLGKLAEKLGMNLSTIPREEFEGVDSKKVKNAETVLSFEAIRQEFYGKCPPEEIQRNKILDICYSNTDANYGNELLILSKKGDVPHAIAIDRGKTLPKEWQNDYNTELMASNHTAPLSKPVSAKLKEVIKNFDVDKEVARLGELFSHETEQEEGLTKTQENIFRGHAAAVKVGLSQDYTVQQVLDFVLLKSVSEGQDKDNLLKVIVDKNSDQKGAVKWSQVNKDIASALKEIKDNPDVKGEVIQKTLKYLK